MPTHYKTIVVGGGITGCCAAYYAMKQEGGEHVRLLEGGDTLGGTAQTEHIDGITCEKGPNGFLDKEPKTLQWVEDLGLGEHLVRANPLAARRFIFRNGTLHELKPPPAFLLGGPLSLQGRLRLCAEPLIPQRVAASDEESIWDFAARRIGAEAADTLVAPMVSGIYGGDARKLDLASCFPRMAAMEAEHGGLFKAMRAKAKDKSAGKGTAMGPGGTLTSFEGGMATLMSRAGDALGDSVRLNSTVTVISKEGDGYHVHTADGTTFTADRVIVAAPTHAACAMVRDLDGPLSEALEAIPYTSMAVVCTAYNRADVGHDLNGFGFLVPRTQEKRMLGCIWTSTLFPGRAPEGQVLLRTMIGGATDPDAVDASDEDLLQTLRDELFPILDIKADPVMHRVYRWGKAIPQYTFGHQDRVSAVEAGEKRHPGLHFAGNAYRGVGLNDCVVSALRAVEASG